MRKIDTKSFAVFETTPTKFRIKCQQMSEKNTNYNLPFYIKLLIVNQRSQEKLWFYRTIVWVKNDKQSCKQSTNDLVESGNISLGAENRKSLNIQPQNMPIANTQVHHHELSVKDFKGFMIFWFW